MKLIEQAAWAYWRGGLSIVPINNRTKRPYSRLLPQAKNETGAPLWIKKLEDGSFVVTEENTGIPKGTWLPYQERQPTEEEINRWVHAGVESLAVVGGPVSGGVEILDFDVSGYYEQWAEVVTPDADHLPVQRTGGGGIQVAYRCPTPSPNQKLAWHPDENELSGRRVAIETRGVKGYAVLPPSLHPSGRRYQLLRGRFSQIPLIDQGLRDFLITCAQALCQAPKTRQELALGEEPQRAASEPYEGESVIDAYNAKYSVETMLQRYGYTRMASGRYSRPGKTDSAGVLVNRQENKTYHMSSNDPLDSDSHGRHQPRSPFDYYRTFEHNGSYPDAVRAAAQELGMIDERQVERNTDRFFSTMKMGA